MKVQRWILLNFFERGKFWKIFIPFILIRMFFFKYDRILITWKKFLSWFVNVSELFLNQINLSYKFLISTMKFLIKISFNKLLNVSRTTWKYNQNAHYNPFLRNIKRIMNIWSLYIKLFEYLLWNKMINIQK